MGCLIIMKDREYFCYAEKCFWRHDAPRGTTAFCMMPTCPRGLRFYKSLYASLNAEVKPKKPEPKTYTVDDIKEIVERRHNNETVDVIARNMERPASSVLLILSWHDKGKSYKGIIEGVQEIESQNS